MTLMIVSAGAISVTAGGATKTSILISWMVKSLLDITSPI